MVWFAPGADGLLVLLERGRVFVDRRVGEVRVHVGNAPLPGSGIVVQAYGFMPRDPGFGV